MIKSGFRVVISIVPRSSVGKYREIFRDGSSTVSKIKSYRSSEYESHVFWMTTSSWRPSVREIARDVCSTALLLLASVQKMAQNLYRIVFRRKFKKNQVKQIYRPRWSGANFMHNRVSPDPPNPYKTNHSWNLGASCQDQGLYHQEILARHLLDSPLWTGNASTPPKYIFILGLNPPVFLEYFRR